MKKKKAIPVLRFCRLSSTNDYAKSIREKGEDCFIVASVQEKGRGRDQRTFSSKKGGLYLSWLHYPDALPASAAFSIVRRAAVAACKTVETLGIKAEIKWPNDVLVGGKKICGILTENLLKGEEIYSSIIGVGLNVNNPLEDDLQPIATSVKKQLSKKISLRKVRKLLIENLQRDTLQEEYFSRLGCLGKVLILEGDKSYPAYAEGVTEDGLLVLIIDGEKVYKSAAEISLRMGEEV